MKRQCAWCGKDMGFLDEGDPNETTHGICDDCLQRLLADPFGRKEKKQ